MDPLNNFIVTSASTIKDALEAINVNGRGVCFVVKNSILVGVVTDGDIRRYLIAGGGINDAVANVMSRDFVKSYVGASNAELREKFTTRIKIVPLVDTLGRLVDFADVQKSHRIPVLEPQLAGNEGLYVQDCISTGWISSQGSYVKKFEEFFEERFQGYQAVAVSNGTVALHLALLALGIGDGDEVVVPNLTFAATINAVLYCGAQPVLCDISEEDWCIKVDNFSQLITEKTKAVIPVHLYGQVAEMNPIQEFCRSNNLKIVEDCAESLGSCYEGKPSGAFGDASTFSFFGNKTISTGEGGMVLFKDSKAAEKGRILRDHGMSKSKRYWHEFVGYNYRLTNVQAAIGCAQMERFDNIVAKKRAILGQYNHFLAAESWIDRFPYEKQNCINSSWLYTIKLNKSLNRDKLIESLLLYGVETRPVFYPLSSMEIYKKYSNEKKLTNSYEVSLSGLSLPSSVSLTEDEILYICDSLKKSVAEQI